MQVANTNKLCRVAVRFTTGNSRVFIEGVPPPVQTSQWFPVLETRQGTKRPVSGSGWKGQGSTAWRLPDREQNTRCHACVHSLFQSSKCAISATRLALHVLQQVLAWLMVSLRAVLKASTQTINVQDSISLRQQYFFNDSLISDTAESQTSASCRTIMRSAVLTLTRLLNEEHNWPEEAKGGWFASSLCIHNIRMLVNKLLLHSEFCSNETCAAGFVKLNIHHHGAAVKHHFSVGLSSTALEWSSRVWEKPTG